MTRRQSKTETAISDEMMAFQHEFVGRGPDRIRTLIVEDLVTHLTQEPQIQHWPAVSFATP